MDKPLADDWDQFDDYVQTARLTMEGQWVPVALICMQATKNPDGTTDVFPDQDATIIWPKDVPVEARGPWLLRLVKPYLDGTVLR